MPTHFDAIIIGAGQAGPTLAGRLTQAGRTVAFIERKLFGGTCVNTGCTPTKAMVASAYVAQKARTAAAYGVTVPGAVSVDMKAVKARKDQIVANSRDGLESWLRRHAELHRLHRPRTLRIAKRGSRRRRPPLRRSDLHQRRRPRSRPGLSRRRTRSPG